MRIIYMPIEPLEERYSKDWLNWTTEYFRSLKENQGMDFDFVTLLPESYGKIENGAFLDCIGTNAFKAKQLDMATEWIGKNATGSDTIEDVVFYLQDGWFPGIEMLAYIRNAMGLGFKIACCLHAGTWDKEDFIVRKEMGYWARPLETAWFNIYDLIFVATRFHRSLLLKHAKIINPEDVGRRLYTTGFPIFRPRFTTETVSPASLPGEIRIVFPHRLDREKGSDSFSKFCDMMKERMPEHKFTFYCTKEICKTKDEYYSTLAKSDYAVSFALQETWGIAMQEATMCGCIPIVPDRLSYQTMYPREFRYSNFGGDDVKQAVAMIEHFENMKKNGKMAPIYTLRKGLANEFLLDGSSALPNQVILMQNLINGQQDCFKVE